MLLNLNRIALRNDFILNPGSGFIAFKYNHLNILFLIMPLLETRDQSQLQKTKPSVFQTTISLVQTSALYQCSIVCPLSKKRQLVNMTTVSDTVNA